MRRARSARTRGRGGRRARPPRRRGWPRRSPRARSASASRFCEGDDREPVRGHRRPDVDEVARAADPAGHRRARRASTRSAATPDRRPWSGCSWRRRRGERVAAGGGPLLEHGVEVDLVDEDVDAALLGQRRRRLAGSRASASAPEGLCGFESRTSRVRGVSAAATRVRVQVVAVLEAPLEGVAPRRRASAPPRQRIVERDARPGPRRPPRAARRRPGSSRPSSRRPSRRGPARRRSAARSPRRAAGSPPGSPRRCRPPRARRAGRRACSASRLLPARSIAGRGPRLGPLHVGRRGARHGGSPRAACARPRVRVVDGHAGGEQADADGRALRVRRARRPRATRSDAATKRIGRTGIAGGAGRRAGPRCAGEAGAGSGSRRRPSGRRRSSRRRRPSRPGRRSVPVSTQDDAPRRPAARSRGAAFRSADAGCARPGKKTPSRAIA